MIKDALYAVTHGQDLSYDLAKDTMNKIMSGEVAEVPMAGFLCACLLYTSFVLFLPAFINHRQCSIIIEVFN